MTRTRPQVAGLSCSVVARAQLVGLALLCGCSRGLFSPAPHASQESAGVSAAATSTSSSIDDETDAAAATDRADPSVRSRADATPPVGSRARPVLTDELNRLRLAALKHVLGRELQPVALHLAYAPVAADAADAADGGIVGNFVPIENESALGHFHEALARLAAAQDQDGKVRILAYGASHTQADTYTGYLRSYLQARFGDGGQGFVLLGRVNKWYRTSDTLARHRGLRVHHARYRVNVQEEPLGLFGAALVGRYRGDFGEIITSSGSPNTRFELHYFKQRKGGSFSLLLDGRSLGRIDTRSDLPGLGVHVFEAGLGRHTIRARLQGNGPVRLFGITAETASPGVVVDTLGIGGARIAASLRWHEDTWFDALRHRNPDLITFAYGTNEVMDESDSLGSYELQLRAVLTRLRKAAPHVSCLLISPFDLPARAYDQVTTQSRLVKIVDAQRRISRELGCGFWDGYAFMGGRGSIRRWASATPPLASPDHIHLTRRGYAYVGVAIGDALMRAYDLAPGGRSSAAAVATPSTALPRE